MNLSCIRVLKKNESRANEPYQQHNQAINQAIFSWREEEGKKIPKYFLTEMQCAEENIFDYLMFTKTVASFLPDASLEFYSLKLKEN